MAANKFATMLHRNTNRLTVVLVYAMLEWILIILQLLNSLFSYLIIKYADFFGLKRPCIWCSRLDHFFDSSKPKNFYRDLVCDGHAFEISKLGYCSTHRKLAESADICEDCSSSSKTGFSKNIAFFPWMKQIGMIHGGGNELVSENGGEVDLKCSCCGSKLESKLYSDYFLVKPPWEVLDNIQKVNLIADGDVEDKIDHSDDQSGSGFAANEREDEQMIEENRGIQIVSDVDDDGSGDMELEAEENWSSFVSNVPCKEMVGNEDDDKVDVVIEKEPEPTREDELKVLMDDDQPHDQAISQVDCGGVKSVEVLARHLDFYIDQDDCHLIPIEESAAKKLNDRKRYEKRDQGNFGDQDFIMDFDMPVGREVELLVKNRCSSSERVALATIDEGEGEEEAKIAELESMELNESSNSMVEIEERQKQVVIAVSQATQTPPSDGEQIQSNAAAETGGEIDLYAREDTEKEAEEEEEDEVLMPSDEIEAEVSIGTDIPDHEPIDDIQPQEHQCIEEDPSTSYANLRVDDYHGATQTEGEFLEFRTTTVETSELVMNNNHLSLSSELNEIEEDKIPDTPSSVDSLHHLHKKLLLFERKESGTEDSLDGSVISDIDAADGVLTVEKFKTALRAERKALSVLYAELEEERSASAVAANQTMAMINRLQEEKAAMQMEALQYQRMMEEQSEYDQEALQLLNELMLKREREKAELEKELEMYRKKVQEYESKEKMMLLLRRRDGGSTRSRTSSASFSNTDDSDGLSVDLNQETKEEDSFENHHENGNQNTPVDAVLYLEESLANFEDERLSILEQLKALEEKLVTLNEEEEEQQHLEDVEPIDHIYEQNGNGHNVDFDYSSEANGVANGQYKEINGKHHHPDRKMLGAKAKRLLPLFDATDAEPIDGVLANGNGNGHGHGHVFDSATLQESPVAKFELENKKHAIEEEVDHVYDRLQALEADREFLKHCITSLRKGDKGIYLLQEILQHLRDLRNVELRVRSMADAV